MKSVWWKCKYCGTKAKVAAIMRGRRVRCPSCASFSRVRKTPKKRVAPPHFHDKHSAATTSALPNGTQEHFPSATNGNNSGNGFPEDEG